MIKVLTHDGVFHADEVLAIAILEIALKQNVDVVRSRKIKDYSNFDYIIDISLIYDNDKFFDHHQDMSLPSAVGLIANKFCDKDMLQCLYNVITEVNNLDRNFENALFNLSDEKKNVRNIFFHISELISKFNRNENNDVQFRKAVNFCKEFIDNEMNTYFSKKESLKIINKGTTIKNVLLCDSYPSHWLEQTKNDIHFIIFKKEDGTYALQTKDSRIKQVPDDDTCKKILKNDYVFRHLNGFILISKTLQALKNIISFL